MFLYITKCADAKHIYSTVYFSSSSLTLSADSQSIGDATVYNDTRGVRIEFDEPEWAITPGQIAAIYVVYVDIIYI